MLNQRADFVWYQLAMRNLSCRRYRFPVEIIQHAVWQYSPFPLSVRDVEDLLAERGIDVSYETNQRCLAKFGLAYARRPRRSHLPADGRWNLGEMFVSINGKTTHLWRPWIAKVKCWMFWSNLAATRRLR